MNCPRHIWTVARTALLKLGTLLAAGVRSLQEYNRAETILMKCLEAMKADTTFSPADRRPQLAVAIVEAMIACIADGRDVTRGHADTIRALADMLVDGPTTPVSGVREVAHSFMKQFSSGELTRIIDLNAQQSYTHCTYRSQV